MPCRPGRRCWSGLHWLLDGSFAVLRPGVGGQYPKAAGLVNKGPPIAGATDEVAARPRPFRPRPSARRRDREVGGTTEEEELLFSCDSRYLPLKRGRKWGRDSSSASPDPGEGTEDDRPGGPSRPGVDEDDVFGIVAGDDRNEVLGDHVLSVDQRRSLSRRRPEGFDDPTTDPSSRRRGWSSDETSGLEECRREPSREEL